MNGKKVGVMQPYIFPYIGYFQLVQAVDTFVFYDDVDYIKGGWINRNRILVNGKENIFTVPLASASSNKKINETLINTNLYDKWRTKFMRTLDQAYAKAPFTNEVKTLVSNTLNNEGTSVAEIAAESVRSVFEYLDIERDFKFSSDQFAHLEGVGRGERLIAICKRENANSYINALGGMQLYDKAHFAEQGIQLNFLKPDIKEYPQGVKSFIPGLSIIDVLMFNDRESVRQMLNEYTLV